MTQQQDVVQAKARLVTLKHEFMAALHTYLAVVSKDGPEAKAAALDWQKRATSYFNYAEEFVGDSDLLGAHKSDFWIQGFAEDCAEILGSMPAHFNSLRDAFQNVQQLRAVDTKPGRTAFANMQRMVVTYLNGKTAKELRATFEMHNLPVYGFDNEVTRAPDKNMTTWMAYIFGAVGVVAVVAISMLTPELTKFQRAVLWSLFAMSLAGIASVVPGFINVRFRKYLVAGGGLAIFALIYLASPTDPGENSTAIPEAAAVSPPPSASVPNAPGSSATAK